MLQRTIDKYRNGEKIRFYGTFVIAKRGDWENMEFTIWLLRYDYDKRATHFTDGRYDKANERVVLDTPFRSYVALAKLQEFIENVYCIKSDTAPEIPGIKKDKAEEEDMREKPKVISAVSDCLIIPYADSIIGVRKGDFTITKVIKEVSERSVEYFVGCKNRKMSARDFFGCEVEILR